VKTCAKFRLGGVLVVWTLAGAALLPPAAAVAQNNSGASVSAQSNVIGDEPGDAPLGDVARNFRKKSAPAQSVIDNDNLDKVMDAAQENHVSKSSWLFSLEGGGKSFQVSSPDVTCSLSFSANARSLLSDPYAQRELPEEEVMKLDGPATIVGDSLEVSVYNGTDWNVRELVVGFTVVKRGEAPEPAASYYGSARLVPAVATAAPQQSTDNRSEKRPDVTMLYHMKGNALPATTTVFHTTLDTTLPPDQEWHWAVVQAKGIPPQVAAHTLPQGKLAPEDQSSVLGIPGSAISIK
jgi:hypothetical protein